MADVRRGRVKRKQLKDELEKPTKEEYAIAKFLRFNAPSKEGKFLGNNAQYFIGSKAVDTLLESKWATGKGSKTGPLFTNRSSCANYCERLLEKGFFQRAARPEKRKKVKGGVSEQRSERSGAEDKKQKKDAEKSPTSKEEQALTKKSEKRLKKEDSPKPGTDKEDVKPAGTADRSPKPKDSKTAETDKTKDEAADEKKRKKKKIKLEPHEYQLFIDGAELYVWMYEPVQAKTFIIGLLLVLGAIAVCLFPLWPPEVRLGVYYLSLAAAGFVGVILSLCIIRMIVFCIVWGLTLGKISFWILPNLTEDVGFFDSFRPAYNVTYNSSVTNESVEPGQGEGEGEGGGEVEEIGSGGDDKDDEDEDDDEGRRSGGSSNSYEIVDATEMDEDLSAIGQDNDQSQSEGEDQSTETKKTN